MVGGHGFVLPPNGGHHPPCTLIVWELECSDYSPLDLKERAQAPFARKSPPKALSRHLAEVKGATSSLLQQRERLFAFLGLYEDTIVNVS